MSNVLVTDAQMRNSLAIIRSLGKKGINITAGEESRFSTSFFSRYCSHKLIYPSPQNDPDGFIKHLLRTIQKRDYDMIFPVADGSLKPIIMNEEKISEYTKIALPPRDIFMKSFDKKSTLEIAMQCGVDCPETYFIDDINELNSLEGNLDYPLIIKPRISSGSRGFKICNSFDELASNYRKVSDEYGSLLIQEYIPHGGELGVYTLFNHDSKPRALTVHERIRSYPVSGGPSTLRKTIKNKVSKKAVEIAFKLLKAMNWVGVGMVEFRVDPRDGSLKLMEVNPRFWGSLQLSILSGVDFPYLLYRMIKDGDVEPVLDYKAGVKSRWLLPGDVLWYLSAAGKIKNLKEFMDFKTPDDIITWEDPGPTLGFVLATLRYMFDKDMWRFVLRR
jgi:predicted ATP-grasp superfamily ATP-dependent carboligase